MSIDQRIRDGLRATNDQLPAPDIDRALAAVTAAARPTNRRNLVVALAAAAAAVLVVVGGLAVVRDWNGPPQPVGPSPTPTPTPTPTEPDRVQRNGQITSAEHYLGAEATGYDWRSFDPVTETGLFVTRRDRGNEVVGLTVGGPNGPITTLTCDRDLQCSQYLPAATLGPGSDEITVESGDSTAEVIGYDGTVRRTLDLGTTTADGAEVQGLRWSADGSLLAVVTNRDLEPGCDRASQLWLVDQGGDEAQLAYSLLFDCAALNNRPSDHDASGFDGKGEIWKASDWGWSPDGQTLLLDVYRGARSSDVVLLHLQPDGAADPVVIQNLYHSNRHFDWAGNVAWSPDGTRIAVRTAHLALPNTGPVVEISASDGRELAEHPDDGGWLIWPARNG